MLTRTDFIDTIVLEILRKEVSDSWEEYATNRKNATTIDEKGKLSKKFRQELTYILAAAVYCHGTLQEDEETMISLDGDF